MMSAIGRLSFEAKSEKLTSVKEILQRKNYHRGQVLPLRQKPFSILLAIYELGNIGRFVFGKRNTFGVTLWPNLYYKVFNFLLPEEYLLYQLFFLNQEISLNIAVMQLGEQNIETLLWSGILKESEDGKCFASVRLVPYAKYLYVTDPWDRDIEYMVYLSYDSLFLADLVRLFYTNKHFSRVLDLCTGTGIIASILSNCCDSVVGTDINQRAIEYARINANLNKITNVTFLRGDLFDSLHGRFDLIVANPPFVFLPASPQKMMIDSYGGDLGIEVTLKIVEELDKYLSDRGQAMILSKAPILGNRDLLLEKIQYRIKDAGFKLTYTEICSPQSSPEYTEFYLKAGISGFKMIILLIERARNYLVVQNRKFWGSIRYQF